MENRNLFGSRAIAISLFVVLGATMVWLNQGSAMASEEADIMAAIEAAYPAEIEACLYVNHSSVQDYKDALEPYLSSATRTPDEVSTRTARADAIFPTADTIALATAEAEAIALATADPTLMPGDKLGVITSYVWPTPHWVAADNMLAEKWRAIDTCQSAYDLSDEGQMAHAFGVTDYDYQDITITGNFADVDVLIEGWTEWLPNGDGRNYATDHIVYRLEKSGGNWKIVNESPIFVP